MEATQISKAYISKTVRDNRGMLDQMMQRANRLLFFSKWLIQIHNL